MLDNLKWNPKEGTLKTSERSLDVTSIFAKADLVHEAYIPEFLKSLHTTFTSRFVAECASTLGDYADLDENMRAVCDALELPALSANGLWDQVRTDGENPSPFVKLVQGTHSMGVIYLWMTGNQFCGVLSFYKNGVRLAVKGASYYMPFSPSTCVSANYFTEATLCARLLCRFALLAGSDGTFSGISMGDLPCYAGEYNRATTLDKLSHIITTSTLSSRA